MANSVPSYILKETRLNLESATPNSTISVRLPAHGPASRNSGTAQKRSFDNAALGDEAAFRSKHLATAASIYHRQHHAFPKSFLWRLLEGGRVLSIQTVDVCKTEKSPETNLTLRLQFPSPIRPQCVAFSDPEGQDVLGAFVLTESNHLYTLTLRADYFSKPSVTEHNVTDWCKIYLSTSFSFKYPHRLVALSARELLVSLHDGGMLKLERKTGDDGM